MPLSLAAAADSFAFAATIAPCRHCRWPLMPPPPLRCRLFRCHCRRFRRCAACFSMTPCRRQMKPRLPPLRAATPCLRCCCRRFRCRLFRDDYAAADTPCCRFERRMSRCFIFAAFACRQSAAISMFCFRYNSAISFSLTRNYAAHDAAADADESPAT